jgi:hypothetical protein
MSFRDFTICGALRNNYSQSPEDFPRILTENVCNNRMRKQLFSNRMYGKYFDPPLRGGIRQGIISDDLCIWIIGSHEVK